MCLRQADGTGGGGAQGPKDRRSLRLEPCPAGEGGLPGMSLVSQALSLHLWVSGDLVHAEQRSGCSGERTSLCQIKPQPELERVGLPHTPPGALHTPEEAGGAQATERPAPDTESEARSPTAPRPLAYKRCARGGSGARSVGSLRHCQALSRTAPRQKRTQRLFPGLTLPAVHPHAARRL